MVRGLPIALGLVLAACQGRAPEPATGAARPEPEPEPVAVADDRGPAPRTATPAPTVEGDPATTATVIAHAPVTTREEALAAHAATFDALVRATQARGHSRPGEAFADPAASRDARRQPCSEFADHIRDVMGPVAEQSLAYGSLAALKGQCWIVYTSVGFFTLATAFHEPDGTLLVAWDIPEG